MKWFKDKRNQLAKKLPKNSLLVLASLPEYLRQVDVHYPYRQSSDFYYLTGFEQPKSLFLLFPSGRSLLFIQDKDPVKELWEGPLYSRESVKKNFLIDRVYYLSDLDRFLSQELKGKKVCFYDFLHPLFDKKIKSFFKGKRKSSGEFLRDFRRIKDKKELSDINRAISNSIHAHKQVARALKPGINERALHGVFIKSIMEKGSDREAYGGIFACGANATILHYVKNNSVCKKEELLLVDAGAESAYYASDITRVYPVSGRFSRNQKKLYEKLLKLQESLIKEVRPGASLKGINEKMFEGVTDILLSFGLLKGSLKENLKNRSYRKYCPHSVGHLLGLDVHDVSFKKEESSLLKPGMVLTIEPGIYISKKDQKVPKDLRGLGLRIEDNILVTKEGRKNLTEKLPKKVSAIEQLCS